MPMAQTILNGLLIGGIYALVAVGLTMNYGVMKIVNFAHGDFLMLGMYLSWLLFPILGFGGIPYWLIVPVGMLMYGIGVLIFKTMIRPVVGTDESNGVILTMGLSYLLQNVIQLIFSPNFLSIKIEKDLQIGTFKVGDLILLKPRLIAFGVALVLVILIFLFLNYTDTGRAMRATSENESVAKTLGINTRKIFTRAFGIGSVLAGLAGLLLTPIFYVYPKVGSLFTTMAMCSIVLGGMGNIAGAMVGGIIIGLIEACVGTFFSMDLALIVNSAVLILILLFKPYGIFGGGMRKA
jgi:branched-chain amino acid transport system permease protein